MGGTMAPTINPAFRLRPLDLGEILDESFRIYRSRFGLLFGVALVANLPGLLISIGTGGGWAGVMNTFSQSAPTPTSGDGLALGIALGAGFLLAFLMVPITAMGPSFAACAAALGMEASVGSILRSTIRYYWRGWGLGFISGAMYVLLVLIFPVYFLVQWAFRYQVVYLEHAGVSQALSRSASLVRGQWWRVFGIKLLVIIVTLVLSSVLGLMFGMFSLVAPAGFARTALGGVLQTLTEAVIAPFAALATTLLYLDARIRRESLDLQLMAARAGQVEYAPPPPTTAPAWSDFPPSPPG
jgi:hypothetical protein